jgi:RHS repeat-associated protein
MSSTAKENGSDVSHELLSGSLTITEPGYVYVFLSNEQGTNPYEVYFDDFRVEQIKSPVIQAEDYYPFGLSYNNYQRENTVDQDDKYNGKEEQTALGLNWLDYGARKYMPEIGRWGAIDYMSEKYNSHSTYGYVMNNPIVLVDPDGNDVYLIVWYTKGGEIGHVGIAFDNYRTEEVKDRDGTTINKDGKPLTRQVKSGTVTFYDFAGSGSPQNPDSDREGTIRQEKDIKTKDLKRLARHAGMAPDGFIQIRTTPYITQSIEQENARLYERQQQGIQMTYNLEKFNCSDFAKASLNKIPGFMFLNGTENVNVSPNSYRSTPYNKNLTTPNFLFGNLKKVVQAGTPRGVVLKENSMYRKDYVNAYTSGAIKDESPNE